MRNKWILLALLCLIFITYTVDRALLGLLAVPIQKDLGLTDVQFGFVSAAIFWTFSVCVPFSGLAGDRFNRAKIIGFAAVAWSAMAILAGFAGGFWSLFFLASVALCALRNGKHVLTELPAVMSVDQAWEVVETAEKVKLHAMMLENACYGESELLFLNLCRLGKIGDLVHGECVYIHDLREMSYTESKIDNPYWEGNGYTNYWRLRWNAAHKGNQYPTHGLGPICQYMGINRVDLKTLDTRRHDGLKPAGGGMRV